MAFRLDTNARNAAVDGITALLNSGKIKIYTGAQNTNVSDAESTTGNPLATPVFGATAFAASSSGTGTANSITSDTSAAHSGTAGHFHLVKSDNTTSVADGTCAQTSGGDMNFDNSSIVIGGTVAISSFTITQPIS